MNDLSSGAILAAAGTIASAIAGLTWAVAKLVGHVAVIKERVTDWLRARAVADELAARHFARTEQFYRRLERRQLGLAKYTSMQAGVPTADTQWLDDTGPIDIPDEQDEPPAGLVSSPYAFRRPPPRADRTTTTARRK